MIDGADDVYQPRLRELLNDAADALAESRRLAGEVASLREWADAWEKRAVRVTAERDELLGEVAQLQQDCTLNLNALRAMCQRAEAAEGEVARLQQECDRIRKHAMEQVKRYDAELSRLRQ